MKTALVALVLFGGALEMDGAFGFDRIDLLSEDPGTFLHFDLPYAGVFPTSPAIRFVTQVKVAFRTPVRGLHLGASMQSVSAVLEVPLFDWGSHGLYWSAGLQSRLLFPTGTLTGLAWRYRFLRLGVGLSALSMASWSNPRWTSWSLLPTVGVGVGRRHQTR